MGLAIEIRRLSERDPTGAFDCGSDPDGAALKVFLDRFAKKHQRRHGSVTYIACAAGEIAGYVTIVGAAISPTDIPEQTKGLGPYPRPVLLLARMATDLRFRGHGVGSKLMRDVVFDEAMRMAQGSGCLGVLVDAKPGAVSFYREQFRFDSLSGATSRMFLPLDRVKSMMTSVASARSVTAIAAFTQGEALPDLGARRE